MFEPGSLSHKIGLALLTGGLLAGTLSSTYASYKAFNTPGASLGSWVLGWILAAVAVMLLGFGVFFGGNLFGAIRKDMEARRRSRLSDTIVFE